MPSRRAHQQRVLRGLLSQLSCSLHSDNQDNERPTELVLQVHSLVKLLDCFVKNTCAEEVEKEVTTAWEKKRQLTELDKWRTHYFQIIVECREQTAWELDQGCFHICPENNRPQITASTLSWKWSRKSLISKSVNQSISKSVNQSINHFYYIYICMLSSIVLFFSLFLIVYLWLFPCILPCEVCIMYQIKTDGSINQWSVGSGL